MVEPIHRALCNVGLEAHEMNLNSQDQFRLCSIIIGQFAAEGKDIKIRIFRRLPLLCHCRTFPGACDNLYCYQSSDEDDRTYQMNSSFTLHHSRTGPLKVCFVCLYGYPLFNPACKGPFGGSEVRVSILAKELARSPDIEVSLVVFDYGQPRTEIREGVRILSRPGRFCPIRTSLNESPASGEPMLPFSLRFKNAARARLQRQAIRFIRRMRFPAAVLSSIRRDVYALLGGAKPFGHIGFYAVPGSEVEFYDAVGADVYIMNGNHDGTAILAHYCRRKNKKFIMLSGSDMDFSSAAPLNKCLTDAYGSLRFLMEYTIREADLVVVQNRNQSEIASRWFNKDSVLILNPVEVAAKFEKDPASRYILWVGKSDDRVKQPDLFVNLAQALPQYQFVMIMNLVLDRVHRRVLDRCKKLSNIRVESNIPYGEVERFYAAARLMVNTSAFEGFPNTFLESAKYGIPIVSLNVDPNHMLTDHGCGVVCDGEFEKMISGVSLLMNNNAEYVRTSNNCRPYILQYHKKESVVRGFRESVFELFR
jgi:glycosyltransferase involved in cell wall biosynthesis